MLIKIRPTSANKSIIELNVNNCNNIIDIKYNIINIWKDIEILQLKLIFAGKILDNDDTLAYHKITNGCTIHCIISEKKENTLYNEIQNTETIKNMQHILDNQKMMQSMNKFLKS